MTDHEQRRTRLGALKALGAAAAGLLGGTLVGKETTTASAATGDALTLGSTANAADAPTTVTVDASSTSTFPANTSAFVVAAADANAAIEGNSSSIGVLGNATTGIMGVGNVGGVFSGDANAIQLNPQSASGAPTAGDHLKGDVLVDADGVLWLCIADSTADTPPGTWIKVSHGGIRLLDQPQRIYDSRKADGAILAGTTRTVPILGANDVDGVPLAVPAEALGIVCNLTVTETTSYGFLQAWPEGTKPKTGSNVNWVGPGLAVANAATVRLGSDGAIRLYVENSDAQAIVDVSAYIL